MTADRPNTHPPRSPSSLIWRVRKRIFTTCTPIPEPQVNVEYLSLSKNSEATEVLRNARSLMDERRPILVEVAIDYSVKTYFTRGAVRVTLNRLPWADRLRFLARAISRRLPVPGLI